MKQLGLGVMIQRLGGNEETVTAVKSSIGKTIAELTLLKGEMDSLDFTFTDGSKLSLWDNGQSCCEHRYMETGDKLADFIGSELLGFELKEGPVENPDSEPHEIQFLDVKTSKGVFQMSNHNEHNGYYGGFSITARYSA